MRSLRFETRLIFELQQDLTEQDHRCNNQRHGREDTRAQHQAWYDCFHTYLNKSEAAVSKSGRNLIILRQSSFSPQRIFPIAQRRCSMPGSDGTVH